MSERYKVVEGSETGHCCFGATVVDTHAPRHGWEGKFDWVCECYGLKDAQKITDALNAAEQSPDVAQLVEALELARRTLAMAAIDGEVTRRIDSALATHRKECD